MTEDERDKARLVYATLAAGERKILRAALVLDAVRATRDDTREFCADRIALLDDVERAADPAATDPWEWAEDRCHVCDKRIGTGVRFMHVGLCDDCAAKPTH